jgi:hypothetical protein
MFMIDYSNKPKLKSKNKNKNYNSIMYQKHNRLKKQILSQHKDILVEI